VRATLGEDVDLIARNFGRYSRRAQVRLTLCDAWRCRTSPDLLHTLFFGGPAGWSASAPSLCNRGNTAEGKPVSAEINIYNPEELGPPMGQYTHVTRVKANEFLFIAGMLSGDSAGNVIGEGDFDLQTRQVFRNIEAALKSAGASWGNVVQFTTYLVHSQDIPKFMEFRLREFPKMFPNGKYPPNTLLMVDRLVKEPFLVEVQTIAAV
jgi:enamine deaminase RidA (YjgF/YER057c/UK114 family)